MISSARTNMGGGMVRSMASAALRLTTSSTLVGITAMVADGATERTKPLSRQPVNSDEIADAVETGALCHGNCTLREDTSGEARTCSQEGCDEGFRYGWQRVREVGQARKT